MTSFDTDARPGAGPIVVVNGRPHVLDAPSLTSLLHALDLDGKRIAVERNGEIIPRSRYADTLLQHGDRLEIVAAVGGG